MDAIRDRDGVCVSLVPRSSVEIEIGEYDEDHWIDRAPSFGSIGVSAVLDPWEAERFALAGVVPLVCERCGADLAMAGEIPTVGGGAL